MRQKVANYPGVTVEHHSGRMKSIGRSDLTLIDLPGIYSLATYSEDARVAVDVLTGKMPGVPKPDCVLLVLDATHMNRQLMLAAPVFSIGLPTLVLLNMSDQMEDRGGKLDTLALARELGHPVALISASKGTGLDVIPEFLLHADDVLEKSPRPVQLPVLQTPVRLPHLGLAGHHPLQLSVACHLAVDAPPGFRAAPSHRRPAHLPRRGLRGLPGRLHPRPAALRRPRTVTHPRGRQGRAAASR